MRNVNSQKAILVAICLFMTASAASAQLSSTVREEEKTTYDSGKKVLANARVSSEWFKVVENNRLTKKTREVDWEGSRGNASQNEWIVKLKNSDHRDLTALKNEMRGSTITPIKLSLIHI